MSLQAVKKFRTRELSTVLKTKRLQLAEKTPAIPNPFIPRLNPETGRWAPPKYSLRQQADLIKHAKVSNTLHLLPPGPKLAASQLLQVPRPESEVEPWSQAVVWEGEVKEKKVAGADIGNRLYAGRKRMFKGHKWERTLQKRTAKRKWLMRGMQARIQRFKTTYKRRRPSPLGPARSTGKAPKLPF